MSWTRSRDAARADSDVLLGQREGHEHPAGQLERFLHHAPATPGSWSSDTSRRTGWPRSCAQTSVIMVPKIRSRPCGRSSRSRPRRHDTARVAQHDGAGHQNEHHPAHGARQRMVCATVVELAEFRRREEHHEEQIEAPSLRRLPRQRERQTGGHAERRHLGPFEKPVLPQHQVPPPDSASRSQRAGTSRRSGADRASTRNEKALMARRCWPDAASAR